MRFPTVAEFAAQRRTDQDTLESEILPFVHNALEAHADRDLIDFVTSEYQKVFRSEGGTGTPAGLATFLTDVQATLDKTTSDSEVTAERIAVWLATAILNAATVDASAQDTELLAMEWVTMHDKDVRQTHRDAEGQRQLVGESFDVGGEKLRYPGDPTASISLWINCRCSLAPTLASAENALTAATEQEGSTMDDETSADPGPLAWHGVLAPEGAWSGDGRMFAENSLVFRELPLPLTWQKASSEGHNGSVVVAKIDAIARVGNEMRASGTFLLTPEADEAVGLLSEFGRFGVSVDADDAEFDFNEETNQVTFTAARIASASMVAIPAFSEAFIALGTWADGEMPPVAETAPIESDDSLAAAAWDGSAGRFTPEQWKRSCVLHLADTLNKSDHKLPIKEPGGALNKAGVHAAAARFNQVQAPAAAKAAAKSALRGAYQQLGEAIPDVLAAAEVETFGRGPGWLTDPVATKRIHDYWTVPGQPGYAKIGWGTPGDFNRCKVEVGQEIAEKDPKTVALYMNQICAQWHHDALGRWPAEDKGVESGQVEGFSDQPAPALSLVAAGGYCAPADWFCDPKFTGPTPIRISDEGRVSGHLAEWSTCHIAYQDTCVAPPHSASDYAYFLTGEVLTDTGTVPVGQLTLGGGHAPHGGSLRAAIAHYDSTSTVVADVTCGEDDYGIWIAGWVRPGVPEETVAALRASSLSGDWRRVNGEMELIAALAVNVPGFPVPRVGIHNQQQVSLVAAGVVSAVESNATTVTEEFAEAIVAAMEARAKRRAAMAALVSRVGGK